MSKHKKYFELKLNFKNRGFTLIELLIALAIMGIVTSLAGSGLYALMNANQRSQIETKDRLELEQALAFMTDEIKMSQQVMTSVPLSATGTKIFKPASGSSNIQPILVLKPASNSGLTNPIVYYLADPPNNIVWLGPSVIYRWGPTLLQNGNYSNGNNIDVSRILPGTSVEYFNEVVIDRMSDAILDRTKTTCESGYSYINSNNSKIIDRSGFYACIAPDQKSVKMSMNKQSSQSAKSQSLHSLVVTRSN